MEALGPPTWSHVGHFGFQNLRMVPPKSLLKFDVVKNGVLEASGLDVEASRPRFWSLQASILEPITLLKEPIASLYKKQKPR